VSGRAIVALVGGIAVLVAAGLVALVTLGGDPRSGGAVAQREESVRPTVRASFATPVHRFGEPVEARLELLARTDELQPDTVRAESAFEPYDVVAGPRKEVVDLGRLTLVRYTLTLRCLVEACLPQGGQPTAFEFGSADFSFRTPPPPGRRFEDRRLDQRSATAAWPSLTVVSRLSNADVTDARWRSGLATLPEPGYRAAPRWLAAVLLGLAVALVALAAVLLARWALRWRRDRDAAETAASRPPTPIEQALALVSAANGNGDVVHERMALETLAAELRRRREPALADRADRLAWSQAPPPKEDVEALAGDVRAVVDGGGT
jgi:hypothetical protein